MAGKTTHEILGIGTPMLDHLLLISQKYLESIQGEKYGMEVISYEEMVRLIENSGTIPKLVAGGSAANTIKGLAALGRRCALTGMLGKDSSGNRVIERLQDLGVSPLVSYGTKPTAHVTCLITPDGKRTCRTYLGAAEEITPKDLSPEFFNEVSLVHIEGYTFLYPGITKRAMELAKENGARISLDLGSFEVVEAYKSPIIGLVREFVDILFANEDETFAMTGKKPEGGWDDLQKLAENTVVMMGKEGCIAGNATEKIRCPAFPVEPLDTTGAGDLFAAGFLHGTLSKKDIRTSAKWGAQLAKEVVSVVGAEIPEEKWPSVIASLHSCID